MTPLPLMVGLVRTPFGSPVRHPIAPVAGLSRSTEPRKVLRRWSYPGRPCRGDGRRTPRPPGTGQGLLAGLHADPALPDRAHGGPPEPVIDAVLVARPDHRYRLAVDHGGEQGRRSAEVAVSHHLRLWDLERCKERERGAQL